MPLVTNVETHAGPVAVKGHTITLVARTSGISLGNEQARLFGLWSRPAHVEVLDTDGARHLHPVRDVQLLTLAAIAGATAACVLATRVARRIR